MKNVPNSVKGALNISIYFRRKKKCVRYPEGENFPPNDQNASLLGAGSPLALAHGMLQNSPLSPQFGQVSHVLVVYQSAVISTEISVL